MPKFLFTPLGPNEQRNLRAPERAEKLRCECECSKFVVLKAVLPPVKQDGQASRYYAARLGPPQPKDLLLLVCLNCRAARPMDLGEPLPPEKAPEKRERQYAERPSL